jgi:hypothetical protein
MNDEQKRHRQRALVVSIATILAVACTGQASPNDGTDGIEVDARALALDDTQCMLFETLANGPQHDDVLRRIDGALAGVDVPVGIRDGKELHINSVDTLSFSGCRASMKLDVTLRRPGVRRNAEGSIVIRGDVVPVLRNILVDEIIDGVKTGEVWQHEEAVCLRNMDVADITLSNLTDRIGEPIIEWFADKTEETCYAAGSLWSDLQGELNAALGPFAPQIMLEQQHEYRTSGYPIGTPWPPPPTVEACLLQDSNFNCVPCVWQFDACIPCVWQGDRCLACQYDEFGTCLPTP